MRSISSITLYKDKFLKVGSNYFPIVKKVDGKWIFKFNDNYYGYRDISIGDIVRKFPGRDKMVSYDETYLGAWYIDKNDCAWFVKLDPDWSGKAYYLSNEGHLVFGNLIEGIDL